MKITVLSKWYNEAELAPFFLNHYSYADEILIYLDRGINDGSVAEIKKYPQAKIIWAKSTGKLNDGACIAALNDIASKSNADWLISVDADEFVFPQNFNDPREVLKRADGNIIYSSMWNMYRHETDPDLDPLHPSIFQRRHGDPNRISNNNEMSTKPNIINPRIKINWGVGCHGYYSAINPQVSTTRFDGAHWQSVDVDISCKRRIKGGKERMSDTNLKNMWAFHNFHITREDIVKVYEDHKQDPLIF